MSQESSASDAVIAPTRGGLWSTENEERLSRWAEDFSDWVNPILVKETRQSLKSWTFLMTFSLLILASWLISVFGVTLAGPSVYYGRTGAALFFGFFWVLGAAAFLIIPFSAYRSLLTERDQATFEVLSITTLRPGQVVWGKLMSSCAQLFVFLSALTPFIAFTWLLRGIDVLSIMMTLIFATLAGIGLSMICLTLSALFHGRGWGPIQTLFIFGQLFGTFISLTAGLGTMGIAGTSVYREWAFWLAVGMSLTYYAGYFYLLHTISVAQLTFDADNRSTPMRLALSGLAMLSIGWGAVFLFAGLFPWTGMTLSPGAFQELGLVGGSFALAHWALFGIFFVTEPDRLTERTRRGIPRLWFVRLFASMYFPGGGRGLVYIFAHLALTLAAVLLLGSFDTSPDFTEWLTFVVAALYVAIYLMVACWLARAGHRHIPGFQPNHARVGVLVLAAIAALVPALIELLSDRVVWNSFVHLANPIVVLERVSNQPEAEFPTIILLVLIAAALFLVNLRAMLSGIGEVLFTKSLPVEARKLSTDDAGAAIASA